MLDLFVILSTGGIVLWSYSPFNKDFRNVVAEVMQRAIIETTILANSMIIGSLEIKWTVSNELGLIFISAYQKILPLTYVPSLLEQVKQYFLKNYKETLRECPYLEFPEFDRIFEQICKVVEERNHDEARKLKQEITNTKKGLSPQTGKKLRDWGDRVNRQTMESLDMSDSHDSPMKDAKVSAIVGTSELLEFSDTSNETYTPVASSGIWRYFDNLTGQKALTKDDLEVALAEMREHLIHKNVASEVAQVICDSIMTKLIGQKTGTFKTISQMVKEATEKIVSKILQPNASVDLLDEVMRVRSDRPYILTFVGVNGVGKSTNLSKVCFWLLQNNLRVLMVAGDTFRSGAVEQLRTHVKNLSLGRDPKQLELFERGYGKDTASIAKEAIIYAKNNSFDVVMIDTAGRMQDNSPLMAALSKLIYVNPPDKLLFVGEALVGNEAVDQLTKFNKALFDNAPTKEDIKRIDGILLTKFDTIDDKVGAALTMTFVANVPIFFVGVGQTYTDLRKLNVRLITNTLLK